MRRGWVFFLCLGLAAVLNKSVRLDRPWTVSLDLVGARYSTIARNFAREGILDPPLVQKLHTGKPPPGVKFGPLTSHPPGVPLMVAALFWITGTDSARAARLAMLPAALLALVLLYLLARRLAGWRTAAASALFMTLMPAAAFYGVWVDPVGWGSLAWILAWCVAFRPWFGDTHTRPALWRGPALALCFVLAMVVEWNAIFVLPICAVELFFGGRRRPWIPIVWMGLALVGTVFLYRAILPAPDGYLGFFGKMARFHNYSASFFETLLDHYRALFGWPVLGLSVLGLAGLLFRALCRAITPLDRLITALLLFQAYYTFLYPLGSRIHDFCSLYLILPLSLLSGRVVATAFQWIARHLGRTAATTTGLLILVPWALLSTHAGLVGWTRYDAHVEKVQTTARVVRKAVRADEAAATVTASEILVSERYYADRLILGGITTPRALERMMAAPERPAAFFLLKKELSSYPELRALLDASAPHRDLEAYRVYDLRKYRPGQPRRHEPGPRIPAPEDVHAEVRGKTVTFTWRPVAGDRVQGYRIWFGNEPDVYPVHFDVITPAFTYRLEARGEVHFVVAARETTGRLGRRTADQALTLDIPTDYLGPILASLAALILLAGLHAVIILRQSRRL